MEQLSKYISSTLKKLKENGFLSLLYALLAETLLLGYLAFIGLFTIETLLPTFVTVRFSLTKFLLGLTFLSFLLALLGRFLDVHYKWNFSKKSPLLWLGILWSIGILAVSLFKFPLFFIPVLIFGFLMTGYLFVKILLLEEK